MAKQKYGKQLTEHLRRLAQEAETIDDDGAVVTKGEALARLLFKRALGYTEMKRVEDKEGNITEVEEVFRAEPWAMQLIWDRIEGKTPVAEPESMSETITVADKVDELAAARMNRMAEMAAGVPEAKPLPPKITERKDDDGQDPENQEASPSSD